MPGNLLPGFSPLGRTSLRSAAYRLVAGASCDLDIVPTHSQSKLTAKLISEPIVVFNWEKQRCDREDIPDTSVRALRLIDGTVFAVASSVDARRFLGSDLNSIKRDCTIVHRVTEARIRRNMLITPGSHQLGRMMGRSFMR